MRWWWDTTNTFHFPWGEMTITPEDYTALTGLTFTGNPVHLRSDGPPPTVSEGTRLLGSWMGMRLPSYQPRGIPFADLMWALEHGVEESSSRQARLFYLHFIISRFLSGPTDTFDPRWIGMVEDVSTLGDYRWGDLGYATLVGQISLAVRDSDPSRRHFVITLAGVPRLIELWAFEHLPWLAPRKGQRPLEYPAGRRWGWKKKLTVRPPPDTVWDLIRDGNPEHVVWTPWLSFRGTYASVRDSYALSQMRVLFVGRRDPVWYLGERVRMQTVGAFLVPRPPPATMLSTRSIGESWRVHSRTGVPATELVIEGASYYQFIQDSLRLPEPGAECPDPSLGGWVLPDARISYTGESGSKIVETFPEERVFHAPLPEGVQAVCTFYLCTLLISFFFFCY
ncbi:protein MAINTENANCE OF MERISTEMS-like [Spinacia oleracea]|uniref:Protein MAINTENANCE OF MERISTEMS-like n=1 Tax=Spinacia oleracea TaxID=3562 RepID=A0ABM3RER4_SPIOL|nr:protein MAINTENANCE OF MERISTEMS-like [Spinacia oleracea]